jgi:glycosyltransferase involved in cell wall biosynthesis
LKKNLDWPWAEYRVLRDARGVLFTCEEERRLARESFRRYAAREMVVSLGISRPAGEPVAEIREFFAAYPKLKDKRIALFMGRIHPKKGCDLLIEAFYKVLKLDPRWHLVFAGPDQVGWAKKLQARAGQLRIDDRLTWTGMLTGAVKWGCFRASEIFVLPSHQENFGVVVAEALAVGVPALISNKVNIWREVQADGAGIVADDSVDGAEELLRVYAGMSTECGALMRERARYCFERRFEIGKVAGAIGSLLSNAAHLN